MAKTPQLLVMTFGSASLTEDAGHPNKLNFRGVLVRLDEPSTKPPNGSNGHRILVPTDVAKRRIKSLVNMGLNYSPSLETHAQKRKVGTITKAWIDGKDLCVEAIVWKHDFPEAEHDLKQPGLGMSMEIGDVQVADQNAEVWKLTDFFFLGATVLWKKSAAYYKTQAIAAAKSRRSTTMALKSKASVKKSGVSITSKQLVAIAASSAAKAVGDTLGPTIGRQTKILGSIASRLDALELQFAGRTMETSADDGDDEEIEVTAAGKHKEGCTDKECEGCADMKGKGKEPADDDDDDDEDDDEDDEIDADHGIDEGDLDELGPDDSDDEDTDDEPGHLSKGAKNKGNKTASEDKVGKEKNEPILGARFKALMKVAKTQSREIASLKASHAELKKLIKQQKVAIAAAGAATERRSIDPTTIALLSKSAINGHELQASGEKLTVAEVDAILAASGVNMSMTERMAAKNRLLQQGLMEDGAVNRG